MGILDRMSREELDQSFMTALSALMHRDLNANTHMLASSTRSVRMHQVHMESDISYEPHSKVTVEFWLADEPMNRRHPRYDYEATAEEVVESRELPGPRRELEAP